MSLCVLVVDDDLALGRAFVEAIDASGDMRSAGHAASLAEGRRLLHERRPDVVLVDLGLPDGNGIALIKEAVRTLPGCEVMVITVFGDEQHVLASIEAGATGYLLKDAAAIEIVEQIRVLCSGGSPISAVIARQVLLRSASWATRTASTTTSPDEADESTQLSPREREVLLLCAKGYTYEEIAPLLGVSRHTVTTFVKRCYRKLQVHSRTEAVYEARRMGLIDD